MAFSITTICRYAECHALLIAMLNVIKLRVIILNVVKLSVTMLTVVVPNLSLLFIHNLL